MVFTYRRKDYKQLSKLVRPQLHKSVVESAANRSTSGSFNWDDVGDKILFGGLLRRRDSSKVDLQKLLMLTKHFEERQLGIREVHQNLTTRKVFSTFSTDTGFLDYYDCRDLTQHPYYFYILYLRELAPNLEIRLKELAYKSKPEDALFVPKYNALRVNAEIEAVEEDLLLDPNEVVPPDFREFITKHRIKKFFRRRPLHIINQKVKFFKLGRSLYDVNSITRKGQHRRNYTSFPSHFDSLRWGIIFNSFFSTSSSSLGSLRRMTTALASRTDEVQLRLKNIRTLYRQNYKFLRKGHYNRQLRLFSAYPSGQLLLRLQIQDVTASVSDSLDLVLIDSVRTYVKSSSVAYSNRLYYRGSFAEADSADIEVAQLDRDETELSKKERKTFALVKLLQSSLDAFLQSSGYADLYKKYSSLNLGVYNIPFRRGELGVQDHNRYSGYTQLEKRLTQVSLPLRKPKYIPIKDSPLVKTVYRARHHTLNRLIKEHMPSPRYYVRPSHTNRSLTALVSLFMNVDTKFVPFYHLEDFQYTEYEQRMHRLATVQGVVFDYWSDFSQLAMPSQLYLTMSENLKIAEELETVTSMQPEFTASAKASAAYYATLAKGTKPIEKGFGFIFRSRYFRLFLYKVLSPISAFLLELTFKVVLFFKALLRFVAALKIIPRAIKAVIPFKRLASSPYIIRLTHIVSVWNATYVAEESLHELESEPADPWDEIVYAEGEELQDGFEYDGIDIDDEFPNDDSDKTSIKGIAAGDSFFGGLFDFDEDFDDLVDDLTDIVVVDIPHYLGFVMRPVLDFFIFYPLWSFIDLVSTLYVGSAYHLGEWYYNFLRLTPKTSRKRFLRVRQILLILSRIVLKSFLGFIFFFSIISNFDYTELQILIVYTFDIPFRDFYYVLYITVVALVTLYFFGPLSVSEFIRDDLGFENLMYFVSAATFYPYELYDPISPALKVGKQASYLTDYGIEYAPFWAISDYARDPQELYSVGRFGERHDRSFHYGSGLETEHQIKNAFNGPYFDEEDATIFNSPSTFGLTHDGINQEFRNNKHYANPNNWYQNKVYVYSVHPRYAAYKNYFKARRIPGVRYDAFHERKDIEAARRAMRLQQTQVGQITDAD